MNVIRLKKKKRLMVVNKMYKTNMFPKGFH